MEVRPLTPVEQFLPVLWAKEEALHHHHSFPIWGKNSNKQKLQNRWLIISSSGEPWELEFWHAPFDHDRKLNLPAEGKLLAEPQHPLLELLVSLANKHFPSITPALAQLREFGPESNASENVHTDWGSPLPSAKTPECPSWQKIITTLVAFQLAEIVPSINSCKSRDFHSVQEELRSCFSSSLQRQEH